MKKLKICATIEARLASTRLPGKVLFPLAGKTTIEHIVDRLRKSRYVDDVILATTQQKEDTAIQLICEQNQIACHRGSVENIVQRLLGASQGYDVIVQATADNPFIDPHLVDEGIELLLKSQADFVCNNLVDSYPRGLEIKIFTRQALERIYHSTQDPIDLVHGSYYFYRYPDQFQIQSWQAASAHYRPELRLTVDEPEDYLLAKHIYDLLYPHQADFALSEIIQLLDLRPELGQMNVLVQQRAPIEG